MKFSGKNVLITGASKGIGAEIAKNLASYGLKVWINYRSKIEEAEAVKEAIEKAGGTAAIIKADVSIEEQFVAAIKTIIESDGELAYLVNNAGITKDKLALKMSVEDFTSVIDANLTSAFIGCREFFKQRGKKGFGAVVNISSIVGEMGNPGQANYSASKAELKADYEKNIPLSRFGNPSEIADAVAFLLSDHSSYITGEILKVNGGLYV